MILVQAADDRLRGKGGALARLQAGSGQELMTLVRASERLDEVELEDGE